jgi:Fe-S-cluster-containing dehydrogenase component
MRVRWLPRPEDTQLKASGQESRTFAFVPVFSESLCQDDPESAKVGLDPACVRACPTDALISGDIADESSAVSRVRSSNSVRTIEAPSAKDLKKDVVYIGLEDWVSGKLNQGAALDPRDEDPIYEQR